MWSSVCFSFGSLSVSALFLSSLSPVPLASLSVSLHKRHQKAMSYSMLATIERLENCAYRISSESKPGEFYTVQTIQLACTCKTKCQYCETCAYQYNSVQTHAPSAHGEQAK